MKKRGFSHIEMIVSFLLFIGFVSVALYFFSPTNTSRLVDSTLTYSFREIENNVSVGLNSYSVKINSNFPPGKEIIAINISYVDPKNEKSVRVEDKDGKVLPSRIRKDDVVGNVVDIKLLSGENREDFIYIKYSRDYTPFLQPPTEKGEYDPIYYTLGTSSANIVISEKRFLLLNNSYYLDYPNLKSKEFNLPNRVDFGFSLIFDDETKIEARKEIPIGVEVFSDIRQVPVIRSNDGKSELANIIVEVW